MRKLAKILTKKFLIKAYIINKKSMAQIAKEIGCSNTTIGYYLRLYKIAVRIKSEVINPIIIKTLTKKFLYQEYIKNKKPSPQIAKEVGCSESTVLKYLKKYKIKIRVNEVAQKLKYSNILTKKFLIKEYIQNKKSTIQIAKEVGCGSETIRRYLKIHKIKSRTHSEVTKGKNNPMHGKSGELSPNYIDGRSFEPYPSKFNSFLKEQIRKRDNYTCHGCAMTQEEHFIIYGRDLEAHHIDYNKQNCKENNLITLCKQCNIRANYNRNYWEKYYKNKIKELKYVYTN